MSLETLPRLMPALIGLYLFGLGPGHAWWHGQASATPRLFARVGLSLIWTSMVSVALAAGGVFSIPTLILVNAVTTLFGYLIVGRRRDEGGRRHTRGAATGILIVAIGIAVFWPPLETHMAASDSSSYLAAGIHLARDHSLAVSDPTLAGLSAPERRVLFPSVLGLPWKPPFSRMPGGMVITTRESSRVYPSFFPLPSVWAALFADLIGPRAAGGYACVFAALAVWAGWLFMRRRMGAAASTVGAVMLALNAACYWSGRFALSEPLVWFFVWAMLTAYDAWEEEGSAADAFLFGAFAGAVVLARTEYAIFLGLTVLALPLLGPAVSLRRLPARFFAALVVVSSATVIEVGSIHGAYLAPITDTLGGIGYRWHATWNTHPLAFAAAVVAAAASLGWSIRRGRARGVSLWLLLASLAVYTVFASHPNLSRSFAWIVAYFGWILPPVSIAGAWMAWHGRLDRNSNGAAVVLAAVSAALVLYDPHVIPTMPWAARRFVPIIAPAMVVFAMLAVHRLGERSRLAATALAAVVAVSALAPARELWGRSFYAGSYDQVNTLARSLPKDGIVIFDGKLSTQLLSTPLWLIDGRPSFTLDLDLPKRRWFLTAFVRRRRGQNVYLVSPLGDGTLRRPIPYVRRVRVAEVTLQTRLPEQTLAAVPRVAENHTTNVVVERLVAPPAARGQPGARRRPDVHGQPGARRQPGARQSPPKADRKPET